MIQDVRLSTQQEDALDRIDTWRARGGEFSLGGYAGTGKTTILRQIAGERVCCLTPTGKASSVLASKGVPSQTIHSYLYGEPIKRLCEDCDGEKVDELERRCKTCRGRGYSKDYTWVPRPGYGREVPDLFVVDEASMVTESVADDLRNVGASILWVGDPAQLPPVGDDARLMHEPDYTLTEIHRQGSGSYVLDLASTIREGGAPSGKGVYRGRPPEDLLFRADMILCGFNRTRHAVNRLIREHLGHEGIVAPGDTLVCLRNARDLVANGEQFKVLNVLSVDERTVEIEAELPWGDTAVFPVWNAGFGRDGPFDYDTYHRGAVLADYGYALTVHKSQGSEWDKVVVIDQVVGDCDPARWRYTAITRASEAVAMFVSPGRI